MKTGGLISRRLASYGSAFVLSVLTLAVFAYSKDQGPESTVRRFHQYLVESNQDGMDKVLDGSKEGDQQLKIAVAGAVQQSAALRLGRVLQDGRTAYVDVVYLLPENRGMTTLRYVVVKPDLRWKVDSDETLRLLSRMKRFE